MKKALLIIPICITGIFVASMVRINQIKQDNNNLQNEIKLAQEKNKKLDEDSQNIEKEITKIKEEKKEKWEELETWQKTKEKITKALS